MNDIKGKGGIILDVVMACILGMAVALNCWTANKAVQLGEIMSSQGKQIEINTDRLDRLELRGSSSLESHIKEDDTRVSDLKARVEKLENAVISLQTIPGEIRTINSRLDNVIKTADRIERAVELQTLSPRKINLATNNFGLHNLTRAQYTP